MGWGNGNGVLAVRCFYLLLQILIVASLVAIFYILNN